MKKLIVILLGAAIFAVALGAGLMLGGPDPATASSTTSTPTTERGDDRGGDRPRRARAARREAGEDVRGPCDEAEHRNDPRCTGAATRDDDDDNGKRNRNRRGSNSGRG
jgi:hypothetical protein